MIYLTTLNINNLQISFAVNGRIYHIVDFQSFSIIIANNHTKSTKILLLRCYSN